MARKHDYGRIPRPNRTTINITHSSTVVRNRAGELFAFDSLRIRGRLYNISKIPIAKFSLFSRAR